MLQVITGKFFRPVELYETLHRGVLFTNYWSFNDEPIELPIGRILPSTHSAASHTFTYELVEKLEAVTEDGQPSVMISTGGSELASDLAVVLSFALNIVCTTDAELTRRLTGPQSQMRLVRERPSQLVPRLFDEQIISAEGDAEALQGFVAKLLALERKTYESVIRAMRQFVFAGHRMLEDLDLAYVLYVMSIESLAQRHDGPIAAWDDYDQVKAKRVDNALTGVVDEAVEAVRRAILENEHVAVSRRFRDFVRDHVDDGFFREEAQNRKQPPTRRDLPEAVRNAYALRSRYVHVLERAPRELIALGRDNDMTRLETGCHFTLAGISRLARHIIVQVVERGPTVETETYAYREDLPNIIRARMAPSMWLGSPAALETVSAKGHLEACLAQFTAALIEGSKEPVSNLVPILERIETRIGSATPTDRLFYLTVYGIWHCAMSPEHHREAWRRPMEVYAAELDEATPATLAAHVMLAIPLEWTVEKMVAAREAHVSVKGKNRLEVPRVLDAAIDLTVAEALRASGDDAGAKALIAAAVEAHPGCEALIGLEARAAQQSPLEPIDWQTLLRVPEPDTKANESAPQQESGEPQPD